MSERKNVYTASLILAVLLIGNILGLCEIYAASLLPDVSTIKDEFSPGLGQSVGKVALVQGDVVIVHQNVDGNYRAKDGVPLFEEDTILTGEKARIRLEMNDGSVLTLSSGTKLVINRSVYNPEEGNRSSLLNMLTGKVRFLVKKMADFKWSEFKVKTKTAIVGVRGSDFIIAATETRTEVTALEHTELEIISLVGADNEPAAVTEFEKVVIEAGMLPSQAEQVFTEEIERMRQDFTMKPQGAEPENGHDMQEIKTEMPMLKEPEKELKVAGDIAEPEKTMMPDIKKPDTPLLEPPVWVSQDQIVSPDDMNVLRPPERNEMPGLPEMLEKKEVIGREEGVWEQVKNVSEHRNEAIAEDKKPDVSKPQETDLPPFPGGPGQK